MVASGPPVVDYPHVMDHLLNLPSCTLITTGRTGTDFLQSLLDSHPQVLTFNGSLFFQAFWDRSVCVNSGTIEPGDLIDEFIGKHIEKLKSRYDLLENKHRLGEDSNQCLDIDLIKFKGAALGFLAGRENNFKNTLIAIYAAYSLCLGQELDKKSLFFHHAHHEDELPRYLQDFPDSKIICMTRDPRANFVSGIEHHRNNNHLVGDTDTGEHLYFYIRRILHDSTAVSHFGHPYTAVRIEALGDPRIIDELCGWLGISYDEALVKSTWGGLKWQGDRLSKPNLEAGWSRDMLENQWEHRLSFTDKYTLNYIMNFRLQHYGYTYRRMGPLAALVVPFLILLPLSYERRFLYPEYVKRALVKREYKKLARNGQRYVQRIALFLKFYFRVTKGQRFHEPFLSLRESKEQS